MNDTPWPSPSPTAAASPTTAVADRPASTPAVAALAALVGSGVGIVVGALVGWLVYGLSAGSCSPSDGWCELGAVLVGLAAGVPLGGIGYVVAGVIAINRHRPRGQRAPLVLIHLAIPIALLLLLTVLGGIV